MRKIKDLLQEKFASKRAFWIALAVSIVAGLCLTSMFSCGFQDMLDSLKAEVSAHG